MGASLILRLRISRYNLRYDVRSTSVLWHAIQSTQLSINAPAARMPCSLAHVCVSLNQMMQHIRIFVHIHVNIAINKAMFFNTQSLRLSYMYAIEWVCVIERDVNQDVTLANSWWVGAHERILNMSRYLKRGLSRCHVPHCNSCTSWPSVWMYRVSICCQVWRLRLQTWLMRRFLLRWAYVTVLCAEVRQHLSAE